MPPAGPARALLFRPGCDEFGVLEPRARLPDTLRFQKRKLDSMPLDPGETQFHIHKMAMVITVAAQGLMRSLEVQAGEIFIILISLGAHLSHGKIRVKLTAL